MNVVLKTGIRAFFFFCKYRLGIGMASIPYLEKMWCFSSDASAYFFAFFAFLLLVAALFFAGARRARARGAA